MSRLVWVGIGAVGGIYAYRKGQRAVDQVRERGVAGTATIAAHTAVQWYGQVRAAAQEIQQRELDAGTAPTVASVVAGDQPREIADVTHTARTRRRKRVAAHPLPVAGTVTMAQWTPLRSGPGS